MLKLQKNSRRTKAKRAVCQVCVCVWVSLCLSCWHNSSAQIMTTPMTIPNRVGEEGGGKRTAWLIWSEALHWTEQNRTAFRPSLSLSHSFSLPCHLLLLPLAIITLLLLLLLLCCILLLLPSPPWFQFSAPIQTVCLVSLVTVTVSHAVSGRVSGWVSALLLLLVIIKEILILFD